MRVLLTAINAKYIHSSLAICSLKASAGKYEDQVELLEVTINHLADTIFSEIYRRKPDILMFSTYIWNRREVVEAAENIRKVLPDVKIWAGGPEVSWDTEVFMEENPQFDGVMMGEGEITFRRLLEYYIDEIGTLEKIEGIAWRESAVRPGRNEKLKTSEHSTSKENLTEETRKNADCSAGTSSTKENLTEETRKSADCSAGMSPTKDNCSEIGIRSEVQVCFPIETATGIVNMGRPAAPGRDLDHLPFVYEDLDKFKNRIIYYETSRGCPFSCSYCMSSLEKKVRFRSLDLVKKELAFFIENKVPQVKFVDRTFNCSHHHAQEIWKYIIEHDNSITNFHFEVSADLLNQEELDLLAQMRPGLAQLEIGVQTTNVKSLESIHRTAPFSLIADHVRQIAKAHNIHQHLDLIAGLPYEGYESFGHSFDDVYELRPQEFQLGFLKLLRGSEMHHRAEEYGIIYRKQPPYEVLETKWISCEELLRLKDVEEMLEVYYNSRQFDCTMEELLKEFGRPFAMYEALADFYRRVEAETGTRSYTRLQRLELLREFVRETVSGKTTAQILSRYDDLLLTDLYLRENAKTRPSWAPDFAEHKDAVTEFYREEEQTHRYLPGYEGRTWKQMMKMTHLEILSDGTRLLFDYEKRDPLTYAAKVMQV